jgi:mRNA interferase MazF
MARKAYIPRRGDIVWIDFDPTKGHEQSGRRPALVLSHKSYNALSGRALFCPITSRVRGHVFEVLHSGEKVIGAILVDQVRSMDWRSRPVTFAEAAEPEVIHDVEARLLAIVCE